MARMCDDFQERLWDLLDGDLDEAERAEMEAHLASCEACRGEMEVRRRVWALLGLDVVPEGRDLTQRILNRVTAETRRRTHRHRLRWASVAAAACLALAVTLTLLLWPRDTTQPFDPEPAYLEAQLVSLEQVSDIELLYFADFLDNFVVGGEPNDALE